MGKRHGALPPPSAPARRSGTLRSRAALRHVSPRPAGGCSGCTIMHSFTTARLRLRGAPLPAGVLAGAAQPGPAAPRLRAPHAAAAHSALTSLRCRAAPWRSTREARPGPAPGAPAGGSGRTMRTPRPPGGGGGGSRGALSPRRCSAPCRPHGASARPSPVLPFLPS